MLVVVARRTTTGIRAHNRRLVLAAFNGAVALTRDEVRRRTDLSRTTVASIVSELLAEGALQVPTHVTGRESAPGRPPTLLARAAPAGYGVGIDMGHERVQVALCDLSGRVLARGVRHLGEDATAKEVSAAAGALLRELTPRAGVGGLPCRGAVAAIPEPIDSDGLVSRTNIASRWHLQRPTRLLSDSLGLPVHAENDANLAIIGETTFGIGRAVDHALYVKISHGVGLGVLVTAHGRSEPAGRPQAARRRGAAAGTSPPTRSSRRPRRRL